ncbi:MAG TPA: hypothetical protein PLZ10_15145, partial [Chitinophagaceae bacterium]|nr:hypothetical protein [Chitinophagaceae bacterium]
MKRIIYSTGMAAMLAVVMIGCQKSSSDKADASALSADERNLIQSAGFNGNWAERTSDGNYLIEGDILLSKAQLEELAITAPAHELVVAGEE